MERIAIAVAVLLLAWLWLRAFFSRAIAKQGSVTARGLFVRGGALVVAFIGVVVTVWLEIGAWSAILLLVSVAIPATIYAREAKRLAERHKPRR